MSQGKYRKGGLGYEDFNDLVSKIFINVGDIKNKHNSSDKSEVAYHILKSLTNFNMANQTPGTRQKIDDLLREMADVVWIVYVFLDYDGDGRLDVKKDFEMLKNEITILEDRFGNSIEFERDEEGRLEWIKPIGSTLNNIVEGYDFFEQKSMEVDYFYQELLEVKEAFKKVKGQVNFSTLAKDNMENLICTVIFAALVLDFVIYIIQSGKDIVLGNDVIRLVNDAYGEDTRVLIDSTIKLINIMRRSKAFSGGFSKLKKLFCCFGKSSEDVKANISKEEVVQAIKNRK